MRTWRSPNSFVGVSLLVCICMLLFSKSNEGSVPYSSEVAFWLIIGGIPLGCCGKFYAESRTERVMQVSYFWASFSCGAIVRILTGVAVLVFSKPPPSADGWFV